jgi:hypothetical protein
MTVLINRGALGDACEAVLNSLSQANARERWFGISTDQSGNDWAADRLVPFVVASGNGIYGTEIKVIGPADTPNFTGSTDFILHRLLVVGVDHIAEYKMRIVYGDSTFAAAIAADQFTEVMVKFDPALPVQTAGIPIKTDIPQIRLNTKIWADCKNVNDLSEVDFYVALREFDNS